MNEDIVNALQQEFPNLSKEEIEYHIGHVSTLNDIDQETFEFLSMMNENHDTVPKASFGDFTVNNTSDDSWEVEAFGFSMNDKDDVFSVGIVVIVALLIYTTKVGIDHWFNKRLERYKKLLDSEDRKSSE